MVESGQISDDETLKQAVRDNTIHLIMTLDKDEFVEVEEVFRNCVITLPSLDSDNVSQPEVQTTPFILLDSETANQIIDSDYSGAIVTYLELFKGLDHNVIAKRMLNKHMGLVDYFADNLGKFEGLDNEVAHELINFGKCSRVAVYLFAFEGLDADVSRALIADGRVLDVGPHLNSFDRSIHSEIAKMLIAEGRDGRFWAISNLNSFDISIHSEIAQELIDCFQIRRVAGNLGRFEGLSGEIADRLIKEGYLSEVLDHLESFEYFEIDQNTRSRLILKFGIEALAKYLNHLKTKQKPENLDNLDV